MQRPTLGPVAGREQLGQKLWDCKVTSKPDPIEVFRKAHELSGSHGWHAHTYAAKLASEASAKGKADEHAFWNAVAAALTPRHASNGTTMSTAAWPP